MGTVEHGESGAFRQSLSAILFADVHGYARLMSKDELGTSQRVNRSIGLMRSLIGDYGGRVVQTSGDGVLALFDSSTQALRFSIDIQREFRNDAVWSAGQDRIAFRIGINMGEVLLGEEGIQGHSINIAARIQALAPPGGVFVSEIVHRFTRDKPNVHMRSMGRQHLKNIPEPVEVFSVEINGDSAGAPAQPMEISLPEERSPLLLTPEQASVAVLPLENLSGDPSDKHLCDGITGDLITNLTRFRDLLVIAQHSAFLFKTQGIPIDQAGTQLGVRYLLTGGLQRAGTKIRLQYQLMEADNGRVVWSDRFRGDMSDIFAFQDEVTDLVSARLAVQINAAERRRLLSASPPDLRAYGLILRGQDLSFNYRQETNSYARRLFEEAATIDPGYGRPYAGMSRTFNLSWRYRWAASPEASLDKAVDLALQATRYDNLDARGFSELGFAYLYKRQHEESLNAYERAIELNANDADILAEMANSVSCAGDTERAVELLTRAMRLNPYYPDFYLWNLGEAYFDLGNYEDTVRTLNKMRDKAEAHRLLASSYALMGQMDEAHAHAERLMTVHPQFSLEHWQTVPPDKNAEPVIRFIEGLRKAGLK